MIFHRSMDKKYFVDVVINKEKIRKKTKKLEGKLIAIILIQNDFAKNMNL